MYVRVVCGRPQHDRSAQLGKGGCSRDWISSFSLLFCLLFYLGLILFVCTYTQIHSQLLSVKACLFLLCIKMTSASPAIDQAPFAVGGR